MTRNPRNLSEPVRFITDHNLGKLAKWLRLLGFDTRCHAGKTNRDIWNLALAEKRIVLTRKNLHYYNKDVETVLITTENWEDQLNEIFIKFELTIQKENILKICSGCNHPLKRVVKQEIADRVPAYILETQDVFYFCKICTRVYWRGSHVEQIEKILRRRNLMGLP